MSLFARRQVVEMRAVGSAWESFGVGGPVNLHGDIEEQALRLAAVYGSVRLLADNISTLPFNAYRLLGDSTRVLMPTQPQVLVAPSVHGSIIDWYFRLVTSLALRGNAYGLPTSRDAYGRITGLEWLNPIDVAPDSDDVADGPAVWRWRGRVVPDLVHLPYFVMPGRVRGLSPIGAFKQLIEQGLSAEAFGADWFANSAIPSGMVTNETGEFVTEDQAKIVKARFKAAAAGRDIVAMGGGWQYTALTVPPEESQFLQTIRANATQIAVIFGVPPGKVGGEAAGSMTYSTSAMEGVDLAKWSLRPYFSRIETTLSSLLPRPVVVRAETAELERTERAGRFAAYQVAIANGFMSRNEVRRAEDLPPIDGGDEFVNPAQQPAPASPPIGGPDGSDQGN